MKKIYFAVDENGYLTYSSPNPSPNPAEISLEVEENHEAFKNPFVFKYENGVLVKDEELQKKEIEKANILKNKPDIEKEIADLWYAVMMGGIKNA